jgi:hypothetical protein
MNFDICFCPGHACPERNECQRYVRNVKFPQDRPLSMCDFSAMRESHKPCDYKLDRDHEFNEGVVK